jgi:predicted dienelactone hydrolase
MNNQSHVATTGASQRPPIGRRILKWTTILIVVVATLIGILIGTLYWHALRTEQPVGFQAVQAQDADGKPMMVAIWYPTQAPTAAKWAGSFFMQVAANGAIAGNQLPLIVLSHGTGGGVTSHADLAMALAAAGHVVAAPMHSDNYLDISSVGTPAYFTGRSQQLRSTIDFMLSQWTGHAQVDANRVGAYGFSIGAFTVLTAAGAQPDLRGVAQYCASHNEFVCDMLRQSNSFLLGTDLPAGFDSFVKDERIKAVVVAAPGLGFTFSGKDALTNVSAPLQLWQGDKDINVPDATNAKLLRDVLGSRVEFHSVPNAAHLSFLAPCGVLKMLPICTDPAGFDRQAFHDTMNPLVVAFFAQQLAQP